MVSFIRSGQFAKWLQMSSTRALKCALLRYPDWTHLNKEVWDTILIILRVAQQRFSSLIGLILFRQFRDHHDYRNASLFMVSSDIWRGHKKNPSISVRFHLIPKPPLHYIMSETMQLILNDPRVS